MKDDTAAVGRGTAPVGRCRGPAPRRRTVLLAGLVGALVVGLIVFVAARPRWQATFVEWWSVPSADSLTLMIGVSVLPGMNASDTRIRVRESPQTVQIAAWHTPPAGPGNSGLLAWTITVQVQLASPLNGRQVVDQNGDPIREQPSP